MSAITPFRRFPYLTRRVAFVGGAGAIVGAFLVIATFITAPREEDLVVAFERAGEFVYHRGGPRFSAYATLGGKETLCRASIVGAYSKCVIGEDGHILRVQYVMVPRLIGKVPVAAKAFDAERVVFDVSPATLVRSWIHGSLFDALFYAFLAAVGTYGVLLVFDRPRNER